LKVFENKNVWFVFPGVICLLIGISFPTSKLYHQALTVLLWLPALFLMWTCRSEIRPILKTTLGLALLAFILWSLISLLWSTAEDPFREAKHVLYVLLSLWGLRLLGLFPAVHLERVLVIAAYFMAALGFMFWIKMYILDDVRWHKRLVGLWQLDHSILAAHVFGFFMVLLYQLKPVSSRALFSWAAALFALATCLLFAQSKGVWLALIAVVFLTPIWRRERVYLALSFICLVGVLGVVLLAPEFALQRGLSYRPELLREGFGLLLEGNLLVGLGLGSAFKLQLASVAAPFDHPHNIFLAIALRFGLVGLLFWLVAWLAVAGLAWRQRSSRMGGAVLGVWLFATLALFSDGDGPWVKPQEVWFLTWIPFGLALALQRLVSEGQHSFRHAPG
jgi:O-antigen ligase